MHAAVVTDFTRPPIYSTFEEPSAEPGRQLVTVEASAVHRIVRSVAAGAHYSVDGILPLVPGVDGIARTADGTRIYTAGTEEPFGMLAERAAVPEQWSIPVPEGLDSAVAAAIVNPAMSGWAPLSRLLPVGGTVLVMGATGVSGGLAVRAAKLLGAERVVAAGRDRERLEATRALGADALIPLDVPDAAAALRDAADGFDVVVDYVWGKPALTFLTALAMNRPDPRRPVEWVQIGSTAGQDVALPSVVLRKAPIRVSGSGIGSIDPRHLGEVIGQVLGAAERGELTIEIDEHPLSDVESAWSLPGRLVFRP